MTMESACLHEPLPLPEHTIRRETPDGGQAAVTLYPVFPGIDIRYHDVHAASCPLEPAAPGVLEISHCREGRMEYRLGSRYFYLAPGDLSVARQDVLPTLAAFPTGHYHGITVTVDPGLAPRCLSCFLEDVEVQPAALAEKFCAAGGYFAARSSRRVEHVFSELYQVPEDLRRGYLKVKILELLLFLSALEVPAQPQAPGQKDGGLSAGQHRKQGDGAGAVPAFRGLRRPDPGQLPGCLRPQSRRLAASAEDARRGGAAAVHGPDGAGYRRTVRL